MKFSVDPETPKNSLIKNVALIILTFNKFSKIFWLFAKPPAVMAVGWSNRSLIYVNLGLSC